MRWRNENVKTSLAGNLKTIENTSGLPHSIVPKVRKKNKGKQDMKEVGDGDIKCTYQQIGIVQGNDEKIEGI